MIPPIAPTSPVPTRPVLSVMMPVRDPGPHLETALRSVLGQLQGSDSVQVAVVDDGSREDIAPRVRGVDPGGRVEIHRVDRPTGLSGNLNRSIALARGHLIHLLHQDDFVLPGFYSRMRRAFERAPMVGMAFCRTRIVDRDGHCLKRTSGPQLWSGIARGWIAKIAMRQRVQAPSAVVARSTYEQLGGFRDDLRLAMDWEMWVRIASQYPVWFEARALAAFRRHRDSETARLRDQLLAWPDVCYAIRLNGEHCRECGHADLVGKSAQWYARSAMREMARDQAAGCTERVSHALHHCRALMSMVDDARVRDTLQWRLWTIEAQLNRPTLT